MSTREARLRAQKKYDEAHTRFYGLKLNEKNDAELIEVLDKAKSKQGLIKAALKYYIESGKI